jgi:hypothetical protein
MSSEEMSCFPAFDRKRTWSNTGLMTRPSLYLTVASAEYLRHLWFTSLIAKETKAINTAINAAINTAINYGVSTIPGESFT